MRLFRGKAFGVIFKNLEAPNKPRGTRVTGISKNMDDYFEATRGAISEKKSDSKDKRMLHELSVEQKQQEVENLKSDRKLREEQANKVFGFAVAYCAFAAFFLFLSGSKEIEFELSDTVLAVVAGSTAVAAISQIGFVTHGLFGIRSKSKK